MNKNFKHISKRWHKCCSEYNIGQDILYGDMKV